MPKHHVNRDFVGVDGEGGTVAGRHHYYLLRAGDKVIEYPGIPLTSYDCLEFLAALPPFNEYVAYFFDYDVTMALRDLPANRVTTILDRQSRIFSDDLPPWPVGIEHKGIKDYFQVDYLPHKELRVRRGLDRRTPWVIINDVGPFFQTAFLKAIKLWGVGTDQDLEKISAGKAGRIDFGVPTDETRDYCKLETELLEDLMTEFRNVCVQAGYVPRYWQGPGNLAKAMLRKHRIPRSKELPPFPPGLVEFAQNAYYGGRFETTAMGPVSGPVYQYDINSAYPFACTLLPCLVHGTWRRTKRPQGLYVAHIRFAHKGARLLKHFPIRRDNGSIFYPKHGIGWYWSHEIDTAQRNGCEIVIKDAWEYLPQCGCQPFDWLYDVYAERLAIGKTGKGIVLKLGANSVYGSLAQSIGQAPYANPIWAGLITSITRAILGNAYTQAPDTTVMLATDGIFTTQPLPLNVTKDLGAWDLTVHDDGMFIIQPGLYFAGEQKPKTRGVPMGKVFERREEFSATWALSPWSTLTHVHRDQAPEVPYVDIPLTSFIGLRLAYARGKPETAGQWVEEVKRVSFDWHTKRRPWAVRRDLCGLRSLPYDGAPDLVTVPYGRIIGGKVFELSDLDRLGIEDSPDWAEGLVP